MDRVEGTVGEVIFRNAENGFTVLEINCEDEKITAVGCMPAVSSGERLVLFGEWTTHRDYGTQFRVSSVEVGRPSTEADMESYLASGIIKGVGPATARLIMEAFGADALDILQYNPERLREIRGIGAARTAVIAESFAQQTEMRNVMLGLQGYGITVNQAVKLYKIYGAQTLAVLRENPYRLVSDVQGIGFRTADKIALNMGMPADSPFRLAAGIKYVLGYAGEEGHTYLPYEMLEAEARKILGDHGIADAIQSLVLQRELIMRDMGEHTAVYLPYAYYSETYVAQRLLGLARPRRYADGKELAYLERRLGVTLTPNQREAVLAAVGNGVTVITGGPGTGKTTIIRFIIELFSEMNMGVELCAPTGRAAKRMTEATGREAMTIHRLLEYGRGEYYGRNENNPIVADVIIVDEMSMVDIYLFYQFLKAVPEGATLVLVGDSDQLPSVGPGNVLKDLVSCGALPVCRLAEIFRQGEGSGIVTNAHRINRGELPQFTQNGDFVFVKRESPEEALAAVKTLCSRGFSGFDPLKDIQVLSPMKKGTLGTHNLNRELQRLFNPPGREKNELVSGERVFRVGDKIMQIRNDYQLEWTRTGTISREKGTGVFNGDMGFITDINEEDRQLIVRFDDEREAVYDFTQLEDLDLAYCISIHKSQGSEFPAVIIALCGGPPMLLARNLLYTGVTRAKSRAVIIGRMATIAQMVRNDRVATRYSGLIAGFAAAEGALGGGY